MNMSYKLSYIVLPLVLFVSCLFAKVSCQQRKQYHRSVLRDGIEIKDIYHTIGISIPMYTQLFDTYLLVIDYQLVVVS